MTESDHNQPQSAAEHYWTVLPKYIAAVEHAIFLSHRIAGHPSDSPRRYWASMLFTRLCSAAISTLHMCPGSPANTGGTHWDFSSLAPLVRSLVQYGLMLFYLGTEAVGEDESRARVLVMQLRDCKERLSLFRNVDGSGEETRGIETATSHMRTELSANPYFAPLQARLRKRLMKGDTASILTEDQILDRLGIVDQKGRAFLWFISSHADVSPLAYCRTGKNNRGTGEENDADVCYIATAVDLACDFILRANTDVEALFRGVLAARSQEGRTAARDERFERALDYVLQWQGGNIQELIGADDSGAPLLCSNCFRDEGLRLSSAGIGQRDMSKCPNCGSQVGKKLNRRSVAILARQFFVWGTIQRVNYGAAPLVQFNKRQTTSIEVGPWLEPDLRLIGKTLQIGFFGYAPRLWMVGEVEPLKALEEPDTRAEVISRILNEYPGRILDTDECFYRLRKAPAHPGEFQEYDAPPGERLGEGRFDTAELPILYGSQDLEVCVHECRVTAEDEVYIATLAPLRRLRLLNLAEVLWEEHVNEFESLDMAVHMLFLAGRHSYEISRDIASAARKCGFDGLVYPSYFTLLRTGATPFETTSGISDRRFPHVREHARKNTISNLALFGRPIADGSVTVRCINRVTLNKVDYRLHFGPLLVKSVSSNAPVPV
jgi:RES domain